MKTTIRLKLNTAGPELSEWNQVDIRTFVTLVSVNHLEVFILVSSNVHNIKG